MEEKAKKLNLNVAAIEHARKLIQEDKVNKGRDNWSECKPQAVSENEFLENHSMEDYGKWFLATAEGTSPETKEHFEFPYGDFEKVYRSGLIAAKQRAAQFGHTEIEQAAAMLLDLIGE